MIQDESVNQDEPSDPDQDPFTLLDLRAKLEAARQMRDAAYRERDHLAAFLAESHQRRDQLHDQRDALQKNVGRLSDDLAEARQESDTLHQELANALVLKNPNATVPGPQEELVATRSQLSEARQEVQVLVLKDQVQENQAWRDTLVADLYHEAEQRGWCDEFDDFAAKHGLQPRTRDYKVTTLVTMEMTVVVTATSEDGARCVVADNEGDCVTDEVRDRFADGNLITAIVPGQVTVA